MPLPRLQELASDVDLEVSIGSAHADPLVNDMKGSDADEKEHTGGTDIRVVVISDTHERHEQLVLPAGDILVHCGDIGKWARSKTGLEDFARWLQAQDFKHKVVIGGNHDLALDPDDVVASQALFDGNGAHKNIHYLQDRLVALEGIRFYGTPWRRGRGCCYKAEAFGRDVAEMRPQVWDRVPSDVNVIVTHAPPYGVLDEEPLGHIGCPDLLDTIRRTRPQCVFFGHCHFTRGAALLRHHADAAHADAATADTLCVNAANVQGDNVLPPFVITIHKS